MKKAVSFILLFLILCLSCCTVNAERKTVEKDRYYLGAMRVVKCKDYVSLRDAPDKTATVLAKVPLDSVVLYCNNNVAKYAAGKYKKQANLYIRCEYDGMEGYILKKYLTPAPEAEPAETRAFNKIMSREEITGGGTIALDWKEFNVAVLAAYEVIPEGDANWEYLRVGCFIDDQPIWGYTEGVKQTGQYQNLRAFMGGTEDEPQVYVYDAQYGLIMLDLMDGIEVWSLMENVCSFGDAAVHTVDTETGNMYIAGTDGPAPIALNCDGYVLWESEIDDPEIYVPYEILLNPYDIQVNYESGKTVRLDYATGAIIGVSDLEEY